MRVTSGGTPSRAVAEYFAHGSVPWVKTQELNDGWIDDTEERITEKAVAGSAAKVLPQNTVLMALYGATVGQLGILRRPMTCNQACCALIVDPEKADFRFLFYQLKHARAQLKRLASGAAQQNLSGQLVKALRLPFPPIDQQHRIASALAALDDKIEVNRRMSETLEAMARALFKQRFAAFSDEGDPRTVQRIDELFEVGIGKTPPRKESLWFSESMTDVPWISIRDLGRAGVYVTRTAEFLTREAIERFRVRRIPEGTVVLSFKLTVGRVAITDREMLSNEAIAHFLPRPGTYLSSEFLYCYLRHFEFSALGSTSSIATAVNSESIRTIPIRVPDRSEVDEFMRRAQPLFGRLKQLASESFTLAALQDSLLPKLVSGAINAPTPNQSA